MEMLCELQVNPGFSGSSPIQVLSLYFHSLSLTTFTMPFPRLQGHAFPGTADGPRPQGGGGGPQGAGSPPSQIPLAGGIRPHGGGDGPHGNLGNRL